MIPFAAFAVGFAIGYIRVARAGGAMPDRLHRGLVTGIVLALLSLVLGLLLEAVVKA